MAIEPIKGFYVHDEATDTDGVAKVSIEAVQEFEDDIREETANWLENNPDIWSPIPDDSLTTDKYKDESVTGAKLANAAVTTEKIENGSVTEDKINFPVSVSHAFLTTLDNKAFQGEYWGTGKAFQSVAYNPNTETYVLAYSGQTYADDGLLVEIDADFQFLRRAIVNAGHLNDLTYIPEKDVYFVANSYGMGKVAVVDPSTLTISETITISGAPSTIDQISYNENVGDLFFTSNRTIYKSDLDFNNIVEYGKQETAEMTQCPYPDIDRRYLQGSCAFDNQFVSFWWIGLQDIGEGFSYNRLCLFDADGNFARFFDYKTMDESDEGEGLVIVDGHIRAFGYISDKITVVDVYTNGELDAPNNPRVIERIRYTTDSTVLDDVHNNCLQQSMYVYYVAFRQSHPALGGTNGFLFGGKGDRTDGGYSWQLFINSSYTAIRRQRAGVFGEWEYIVSQSSSTKKTQTLTFNGKPFTFTKVGYVIELSANTDLSSGDAGDNTIGTIEPEFRPPAVVRTRIVNSSSNTFLTIEPTGRVHMYLPSAVTSATNNGFQCTYFSNTN